jgi:hypothetical protein
MKNVPAIVVTLEVSQRPRLEFIAIAPPKVKYSVVTDGVVHFSRLVPTKDTALGLPLLAVDPAWFRFVLKA